MAMSDGLGAPSPPLYPLAHTTGRKPDKPHTLFRFTHIFFWVRFVLWIGNPKEKNIPCRSGVVFLFRDKGAVSVGFSCVIFL
jgi:hypothetical protein